MDRPTPVSTRSSARPGLPTTRRLALHATVATAMVAASTLLGGSATGAAPATGDVTTSATQASVTMGDDFFEPGNVTIDEGGSVTWTNTGDDHTVTANNGSFNSGNMVDGDTYSRVFNNAGSFDYVCAYHSDMRGTVVVNAVSAPAPVVARIVSFGPTPLHLAGRHRVRGVYRIGQPSTLRAKVQHLRPTRTVRTWPRRSTSSAGRVSYAWDGRNNRRRNVRPGRYRMVLSVTDRAGTRRVVRKSFRVVR